MGNPGIALQRNFNPPYLRIMRKSAEAQSMPSIVHGAPNLYFLFASMSLFNLREEAEWYILFHGVGLRGNISKHSEITFYIMAG